MIKTLLLVVIIILLMWYFQIDIRAVWAYGADVINFLWQKITALAPNLTSVR